MVFVRMDAVRSVIPGEIEPRPDPYDDRCRDFCKRLWGVSAGEHPDDPAPDHIEMIIRADEGEGFIVDRLKREKRCGHVEQIGAHSWRFTADVHDALEMLPWIRSFIGRIERLQCSDPRVERRFHDDLQVMLAMYGGEDHALS